MGRANHTKSVFGVACHSIVRADTDEPCLVEAFTVTPANGDPADAIVPLLRRIHDRRADDPVIGQAASDGLVAILGDVIADPGYTMAGASRWWLQIKRLGATPIGRLHRTNQDGPQRHTVGRGQRVGELWTYGGRPVCECINRTGLAELRFPTFPYTRAELAAYQRQIEVLDRFEWRPNGAPRADGKRSWLSPHGSQRGPDGQPGGCEHCTTVDGPIVDDNGRRVPRCCTTRSRLIPDEVTAFDAGVRHGGPDWYERWNARNRVEGSYGVLKSLAVVNYGRDFHRFVGLARETLVTLFAVIAYNAHMLAQWRARQAFTDNEPAVELDLPSAQPTETMPDATAIRARGRRKPRRGPKGLEFLAGPEPPG